LMQCLLKTSNECVVGIIVNNYANLRRDAR